ncbi:hypothetical protein [Mesorhizobium sp.]|uniref:hypothetical protein n=1 Tax=Mesorhizobium sp. TaxID=1871066 RepID=UPI000FE31A40|nr:hypothetical protein [Mesorhizobium sp.]RWK35473.1 MAG: hypothetical protein EOR40_16260 [Mesorhizobium sp.]TIP18754.1 MAG: hypothetical protein E5X66_13400 [Mesorhizobium sp.]TJV83602.1 MAG: hypothetical protein E5X45_10770 [Mesorhizobium sp.]TJW20721.1 MAG: hypothetical protein E5X42_07975 [Mesorhizobium sp.]
MIDVMKSAEEVYRDKAKRVEAIIPTFDPANGDMILVYALEDERVGRSFRLSPELGATFRELISLAIRTKAN